MPQMNIVIWIMTNSMFLLFIIFLGFISPVPLLAENDSVNELSKTEQNKTSTKNLLTSVPENLQDLEKTLNIIIDPTDTSSNIDSAKRIKRCIRMENMKSAPGHDDEFLKSSNRKQQDDQILCILYDPKPELNFRNKNGTRFFPHFQNQLKARSQTHHASLKNPEKSSGIFHQIRPILEKKSNLTESLVLNNETHRHHIQKIPKTKLEKELNKENYSKKIMDAFKTNAHNHNFSLNLHHLNHSHRIFPIHHAGHNVTILNFQISTPPSTGPYEFSKGQSSQHSTNKSQKEIHNSENQNSHHIHPTFHPNIEINDTKPNHRRPQFIRLNEFKTVTPHSVNKHKSNQIIHEIRIPTTTPHTIPKNIISPETQLQFQTEYLKDVGIISKQQNAQTNITQNHSSPSENKIPKKTSDKLISYILTSSEKPLFNSNFSSVYHKTGVLINTTDENRENHETNESKVGIPQDLYLSSEKQRQSTTKTKNINSKEKISKMKQANDDFQKENQKYFSEIPSEIKEENLSKKLEPDEKVTEYVDEPEISNLSTKHFPEEIYESNYEKSTEKPNTIIIRRYSEDYSPIHVPQLNKTNAVEYKEANSSIILSQEHQNSKSTNLLEPIPDFDEEPSESKDKEVSINNLLPVPYFSHLHRNPTGFLEVAAEVSERATKKNNSFTNIFSEKNITHSHTLMNKNLEQLSKLEQKEERPSISSSEKRAHHHHNYHHTDQNSTDLKYSSENTRKDAKDESILKHSDFSDLNQNDRSLLNYSLLDEHGLESTQTFSENRTEERNSKLSQRENHFRSHISTEKNISDAIKGNNSEKNQNESFPGLETSSEKYPLHHRTSIQKNKEGVKKENYKKTNKTEFNITEQNKQFNSIELLTKKFSLNVSSLLQGNNSVTNSLKHDSENTENIIKSNSEPVQTEINEDQTRENKRETEHVDEKSLEHLPDFNSTSLHQKIKQNAHHIESLQKSNEANNNMNKSEKRSFETPEIVIPHQTFSSIQKNERNILQTSKSHFENLDIKSNKTSFDFDDPLEKDQIHINYLNKQKDEIQDTQNIKKDNPDASNFTTSKQHELIPNNKFHYRITNQEMQSTPDLQLNPNPKSEYVDTSKQTVTPTLLHTPRKSHLESHKLNTTMESRQNKLSNKDTPRIIPNHNDHHNLPKMIIRKYSDNIVSNTTTGQKYSAQDLPTPLTKDIFSSVSYPEPQHVNQNTPNSDSEIQTKQVAFSNSQTHEVFTEFPSIPTFSSPYNSSEHILGLIFESISSSNNVFLEDFTNSSEPRISLSTATLPLLLVSKADTLLQVNENVSDSVASNAPRDSFKHLSYNISPRENQNSDWIPKSYINDNSAESASESTIQKSNNKIHFPSLDTLSYSPNCASTHSPTEQATSISPNLIERSAYSKNSNLLPLPSDYVKKENLPIPPLNPNDNWKYAKALDEFFERIRRTESSEAILTTMLNIPTASNSTQSASTPTFTENSISVNESFNKNYITVNITQENLKNSSSADTVYDYPVYVESMEERVLPAEPYPDEAFLATLVPTRVITVPPTPEQLKDYLIQSHHKIADNKLKYETSDENLTVINSSTSECEEDNNSTKKECKTIYIINDKNAEFVKLLKTFITEKLENRTTSATGNISQTIPQTSEPILGNVRSVSNPLNDIRKKLIDIQLCMKNTVCSRSHLQNKVNELLAVLKERRISELKKLYSAGVDPLVGNAKENLSTLREIDDYVNLLELTVIYLARDPYKLLDEKNDARLDNDESPYPKNDPQRRLIEDQFYYVHPSILNEFIDIYKKYSHNHRYFGKRKWQDYRGKDGNISYERQTPRSSFGESFSRLFNLRGLLPSIARNRGNTYRHEADK